MDSMVRSALARSSALRLAKALSIERGSGLSWRQVEQRDVHRFDRLADARGLVANRGVHDRVSRGSEWEPEPARHRPGTAHH